MTIQPTGDHRPDDSGMHRASAHDAARCARPGEPPTQRLRTALWLRTPASRAQLEKALRALPCTSIDGARHGPHGDYLHIVYDVDLWDIDDTPLTHAALLSNLRSVLHMYGIAHEPVIGHLLAPTPLPLPDTLSVLIVEDQEDTALALADELRDRGHRVSLSDNGLDGVRIATLIRPDVVLLDLAIPDMDGIDTCRLLRSLAVVREAVVIAVTGHGRERIVARGFDDQLLKPVSPADLDARFRRLVARKRRLARLQ